MQQFIILCVDWSRKWLVNLKPPCWQCCRRLGVMVYLVTVLTGVSGWHDWNTQHFLFYEFNGHWTKRTGVCFILEDRLVNTAAAASDVLQNKTQTGVLFSFALLNLMHLTCGHQITRSLVEPLHRSLTWKRWSILFLLSPVLLSSCSLISPLFLPGWACLSDINRCCRRFVGTLVGSGLL